MTDLEKVQQLIDSKTKENNYLAMCLMLEVLGLSFDESFAKLQLCEKTPYQFSIEIAEIRIFYDVEIIRTIDVPSIWGYINRYIYVNEKSMDNAYAQIYIEEDIAWNLDNYPEKKADDLELLQNDIKHIIPIVKALFEQVHSPNK